MWEMLQDVNGASQGEEEKQMRPDGRRKTKDLLKAAEDAENRMA